MNKTDEPRKRRSRLTPEQQAEAERIGSIHFKSAGARRQTRKSEEG